MQSKLLSLTFAAVSAQQNLGESEVGRPNWIRIDNRDLKYNSAVPSFGENWPKCLRNEDCGAGYVCADHMW